MNIMPHKAYKRSRSEISKSIKSNKPSCTKSRDDFRYMVISPHREDNKLVDSYKKHSAF